jgi:hypothetical protein
MATSFKAELESAAGKSAIAFAADHAFNAGSIAPMLKRLIGAFSIEHTEKVLAEIDVRVAEKRKSKKVLKVSTSPRVSEMRGLMKLREWKCWPSLLDTLATLNASKYDCVNVSNWFRKSEKKGGSGIDKVKGVAPNAATVRAVMDKAATRKPKAKAQRTPLARAKADPVAFLAALVADADVLAKLVKNGDASPLIANVCKALKSLRPFVTEVANDAK